MFLEAAEGLEDPSPVPGEGPPAGGWAPLGSEELSREGGISRASCLPSPPVPGCEICTSYTLFCCSRIMKHLHRIHWTE